MTNEIRLRRHLGLIGCFGLALAIVCGSTATSANPSRGCAAPPPSKKIVSVKDKGARGNAAANDTVAIQAAIDAIAGTGGTVLVPPGTYLVDAHPGKGLKLKSNMTLRLADGAVLKVIPNDLPLYTLISVAKARDVTIEGGVLEGDRKEHLGTKGEWGMGIRIGPEAENVTVSATTARKMWGDGIYVSGATTVKICGFTADRNRRQGMSIIEADGIIVTNSVFKNTRGTRPSAGIDFEPNEAHQKIMNVRIENSKFIDNAGAGVMIAGKRGEVSKIEIMGNVFEGTLPIVVEHARRVADEAICANRHISRPGRAEGSLTQVAADPVPVVVVQDGCGDRRLVVRRGKGSRVKP
jgi:hypothetical protein